MTQYAPIISTVDIVMFSYNWAHQQLMVYLKPRTDERQPFYKSLALVGGFIRAEDHDLSDAVKRITKEKCAHDFDEEWMNIINIMDCSQPSFIIGNRERDPRGWSISHVYSVFAPMSDYSVRQNSDFHLLQTIEQTDINLAFDHKQLIYQAVQNLKERCQNDFSYAISVATQLIGTRIEFTLSQLQTIYELISQTTTNGKTFRRKLDEMEQKLITETGKELRGIKSRPAKLYHVNG